MFLPVAIATSVLWGMFPAHATAGGDDLTEGRAVPTPYPKPLPLVRGTAGPPLCVLYRTITMERRTPEDYPAGVAGDLCIAIWPNGRMLWAKDMRYGIGPYYEGRVSSKSVRDLVEEIRRQGIFARYRNGVICSTVSTTEDTIVVYDGSQYLYLGIAEDAVERVIRRQWEQRKRQTNGQSPSHGHDIDASSKTFSEYVARLSEKEKDRIIEASYLSDWIKHRRNWLILKRLITSLIPKNGKRIGNVTLKSHTIDIESCRHRPVSLDKRAEGEVSPDNETSR